MKRIVAPRPLLTAVICFALAIPLFAQDSTDLTTRANAAVQASDWELAAKLFAELTAAEPENGTAWFRLGQATIESGGDTDAGRSAFAKAEELGFPAGLAQFGIAKSYLVDGDTGTALDTLEALADQGPTPYVVARLNSDELFAKLTSNTEYQAVLERLTPCTSEEYRQFDFWLGDWTVFSPQGQEVGTNVVTSALDGCALIENWTSAAGGKGMSVNYFDRDKGTWSQIYRDSSGNISQWPELVGGLVDGAMVLDSGPGSSPRTRWKWSLEDDGSVRQMAESTTDEGETWNVVWDSFYRKAAE